MRKLLLAGALLCSSAHAQFFTGNDLLTRINSDNSIDRTLAMGFIMGVYDSSLLTEHCPPSNVTAGQVRDMVATRFIQRSLPPVISPPPHLSLTH